MTRLCHEGKMFRHMEKRFFCVSIVGVLCDEQRTTACSASSVSLGRRPDMRKPIATIKDVAREAGVSISTVSSVVNGNKPVSGERVARVREVIERLGFHPNQMARSLHAKRTRTLAYL